MEFYSKLIFKYTTNTKNIKNYFYFRYSEIFFFKRKTVTGYLFIYSPLFIYNQISFNLYFLIIVSICCLFFKKKENFYFNKTKEVLSNTFLIVFRNKSFNILIITKKKFQLIKINLLELLEKRI